MLLTRASILSHSCLMPPLHPPVCTIDSNCTSLTSLRQSNSCVDTLDAKKQWNTDALSLCKVHLDDGERVRGLSEVEQMVEQHPQEVIERESRCGDPHNGVIQVLRGRGLYQGGMQLKLCPLHAAGSPFWLPPPATLGAAEPPSASFMVILRTSVIA
jgi:hypothetical protein